MFGLENLVRRTRPVRSLEPTTLQRAVEHLPDLRLFLQILAGKWMGDLRHLKSSRDDERRPDR